MPIHNIHGGEFFIFRRRRAALLTRRGSAASRVRFKEKLKRRASLSNPRTSATGSVIQSSRDNQGTKHYAERDIFGNRWRSLPESGRSLAIVAAVIGNTGLMDKPQP